MSLGDKVRRVAAGVIMVVFVGVGLSLVTVVQRPPQSGIELFSLTYVVFANGIAVWIALSVLRKERLGLLSYVVGELILGNVADVTPLSFSGKVKGTFGAMLIVAGFLTLFVTGVFDSSVLSALGSAYDAATRGLTYVFWLPLRYLWGDLPVGVTDLFAVNNQNAGSLAAAAAVMLGELIDAVGVSDPDDLVA
jgi:hypothetical protein